MVDEGVIKFRAEHRRTALEPSRYGALACSLIAWREILGRTGLVGQDPARYGGFGFGNVSARVGPPAAPKGRRSFLITGTQTAGLACIGVGDLCVVERYDARANRATSHGLVLPSSESLTHGAVYDLGPQIRFVFHGHGPVLWRRARELRIPVSDPRVAYGTPEMAAEVQRLFRSGTLGETQIFAMGGHEDGIVVYGRSAEEAGQILLRYLARAYESQCAADRGLCRTDL